MSEINKIPCYLTRRPNGNYLLTYWEPIITTIGTTQEKDVYMQPGDPIGYNNMCPWSIEILWGLNLDPFDTVPVYFGGCLR